MADWLDHFELKFDCNIAGLASSMVCIGATRAPADGPLIAL